MYRSLAVALAVVFAIAAAPLAAQVPDFAGTHVGFTTNAHVSGEPASAAAGDLDGDGDVDLALVNESTTAFGGPLTILLNDGTGIFTAHKSPETLEWSSLAVALADLDGDGDLDAVESETAGNYLGYLIGVYRNTGNASFPDYTHYAAGAQFSGPVGLAIADFSGDGRNDVAVALYKAGAAGAVALLRNDGAGGLLPPVHYAAASGTYALAAADMDGDGKPDLVTGGDAGKVCVLLNTGSGFAAPAIYAAVATGTAPFGLALGDVDEDGDPDVAYSNGGPSALSTLVLLENIGGGGLGPAQELLADPELNGSDQLTFADVTGDGHLDLLGVAVTQVEGWMLMAGDGDGGFAAPVLRLAAGRSSAVVPVDVDSDGDLDSLVVASEPTEVAVCENLGDGSFAELPRQIVTTALGSSGDSLELADIDGDGDLDAALSYLPGSWMTGSIAVLRNTGDGSYAAPEDYPTPEHAERVKLRDLDGDAAPDLLWQGGDDSWSAYMRLNDGSGAFGPAVALPGASCYDADVDAADVDGDGDLDLLVGRSDKCGSTNAMLVSLNDGRAGFGAPIVRSIDGWPERLLVADVNGDGDLDLLTTAAGWVDVCLGHGDGSFDAPVSQKALTDNQPRALAVVDLDGDGRLDLVTQHRNGGGFDASINVRGGDGAGHFGLAGALSYSRPTTSASSTDSRPDLAVGDIDDDGDPDVLATNWGSYDVSLFRNDGTGVLAPQLRYGLEAHPVAIRLADVTGDGQAELVAHVQLGEPSEHGPLAVMVLPRTADPSWKGLGHGLASTTGVPLLLGSGALQPGEPMALSLTLAPKNKFVTLVVGAAPLNAPFKGGVMVPFPSLLLAGLMTNSSGVLVLGSDWPTGVPAGFSVYFQYWLADTAGPFGFSASNGLRGIAH